MKIKFAQFALIATLSLNTAIAALAAETLSQQGTPAPLGALADLESRPHSGMRQNELAWLADNFPRLGSDELRISGASACRSPLADRQRLAGLIAPQLAEILADPSKSTAGVSAPYAAFYAQLVTGAIVAPNESLSAMQPTIEIAVLSQSSHDFFAKLFLQVQWEELLTMPLSASQIANLKTILNNSQPLNVSVTPADRAKFRAQVKAMSPAF